MNSGERMRPKDRPAPPTETYIDYGPNLPNGYGVMTLHALVRDPRCVFAYWEWPMPTTGRAWAVRLKDVETRQGPVHKLDHDGAKLGSFHFDAEPDRPYEVELGWVEGNAFSAVQTSNAVRTPRDRPSTVVDPEFAPGPGESEMLGGFAGEVFVQGSLHLRRWGPSHA